jgi:hypothetical protein
MRVNTIVRENESRNEYEVGVVQVSRRRDSRDRKLFEAVKMLSDVG